MKILGVDKQWPFIHLRNLERPPKWLVDWAGGGESASGIMVNEETALTFSAVWSAVKLLGESIAQLPFMVYHRNETGKEVDKTHPIYGLIHESPNDYMSKFTFIQTLMNSVLLWGNGYARIRRDQNERPIALELLMPQDVTVKQKGKVWYEVAGQKNMIPARNMIHVLGFSTDGIIGKSPIEVAKDSVGLGLAAQSFANKFYKNGTNSTGALEVPAKLDDEQYNRLRKQFDGRTAGLENANKSMILESGMQFKQITIPPDQAQFIQTRNFQVNEIARIFNIPPHMIGDLERSTNNNIEQQSIEFVQYSVMPWVRRIEEEFTRKLLYEIEKPDYFVEVNVDGLLRGDVKARGEFYRLLWNIGAINDNEIRAFENLNPVEGGNEFYIPVNMTKLNESNRTEPADQE